MRKVLKILTKILLIVLCWHTVERFCHKRTDGFALYKIFSTIQPSNAWAVAPLSAEAQQKLLTLFDQPFRYLGKGAQSFVFLSEDGKYVIKFFRHYRTEIPLWMKAIPFYPTEEYLSRRRVKRFKDFESYKIAYEEFQEETGIVYLHLNKTSNLKCKLTCYDKIGVRHEVDLDNLEFLIQKKAKLIYPTIGEWIEKKEIEKAEFAITRLVELLYARCTKGINDKDPNLNSNFGLIGIRPIQLDPGRYTRSSEKQEVAVYREEILRISDNFKQWLDAKSPPLSEHLLKEIDRVSREEKNAQ